METGLLNQLEQQDFLNVMSWWQCLNSWLKLFYTELIGVVIEQGLWQHGQTDLRKWEKESMKEKPKL